MTSSGGFSFGTALGTPAAAAAVVAAPATTSAPTTLGLGGSLFAQKPAGGFSFNTPASSNIYIYINFFSQMDNHKNVYCLKMCFILSFCSHLGAAAATTGLTLGMYFLKIFSTLNQ